MWFIGKRQSYSQFTVCFLKTDDNWVLFYFGRFRYRRIIDTFEQKLTSQRWILRWQITIDLPMIGRSVFSPTLLWKGSTNMSINVASDICRQINEKTMAIPPVFIVFLIQVGKFLFKSSVTVIKLCLLLCFEFFDDNERLLSFVFFKTIQLLGSSTSISKFLCLLNGILLTRWQTKRGWVSH